MGDEHDHHDDNDGPPWHQAIVMPVLLDLARKRYGTAIATALAGAGYTDVPKRGARLIGGIARNGQIQQDDLARAIGASKQVASQLIDTCVTRGYLERLVDPADRRRMIISLTPRGEDAAAVVRGAVDHVDAALLAALGADGVAGLRRTLGAFVELEIDRAPVAG